MTTQYKGLAANLIIKAVKQVGKVFGTERRAHYSALLAR